MTNTEVRMIWLYMKETWAAFPIPDSPELRTVKEMAWMDQLSDLDAGLVRAAVAALGAREFAPNPAQVRAQAVRLQGQERGQALPPDADQAWLEFKSNYTWRGSRIWSHPAVAETARTVGCEAFGSSAVGDEAIWRAQFVRLYAICCSRLERDGAQPAPVLARRSEQIEGPRRIDPMAALMSSSGS